MHFLYFRFPVEGESGPICGLCRSESPTLYYELGATEEHTGGESIPKELDGCCCMRCATSLLKSMQELGLSFLKKKSAETSF
jgi:hypothetical protein